ncbi:class I SAM-dependent methyltransferase [Halorubrum sp. DTA98]|uniref:class I SAM-dependent methyltransferase n=1 Tax=Halorubrum sp. DTA98 TaxID=3402163 RepID=UPI003AAE4CE7
MALTDRIYRGLPHSLRPFARRVYNLTHPDQVSDEKLQERRKALFDSEHKYQEYRKEFEDFVASQTDADDIDLWFSDIPGGISFREGALYYSVVRELEPDYVVETGVANGNSSAAVLAALERNENGTLYSVDLPFEETTIEQDQIIGDSLGNLVPDEFRHRWDFRKGYSQELLPELFLEIDEIDVFIHDSDHSAPCMMFEYELAWTWLRTGGVLISDDINQNDAFRMFGEERASVWGPIEQNTGFAIKD